MATSKHIGVLAFPFATHAAPLLSLIRRLSNSIPDAKFSFFSTQVSNKSIFQNNDAHKMIKPYDVEDGLPENWSFSHTKPNEPVEIFLKATPGNFKMAMDVAVKETGMAFSCLISDAFLWFTAEIADDMQVPWVPLWTAGPLALLVHVDTDLIRRKLTNEKSAQIFPGIAEIREEDIPDGILRDKVSPFSVMLHKMGVTLPKAAAVATNSFEELDLHTVNALKSKMTKFLNVGPFALTSNQLPSNDPDNCIEWLDKQEEHSVIYISFGSVIQPPPHELSAIADSLEETGFPFLWSFRGNPEEKLPNGFLERTSSKGKVVKWAPQLEILSHSSVGVFMTHCGWNSVLESVIGGVPLICRPFFGDQKLNTRIVEAIWGTGLGIEGGNITKGGLMKGLKVILCSEEGKKMREKLNEKKQLAINAVKSDGSSSQNFKTLVEVVGRFS